MRHEHVIFFGKYFQVLIIPLPDFRKGGISIPYGTNPYLRITANGIRAPVRNDCFPDRQNLFRKGTVYGIMDLSNERCVQEVL